MTGLRIIAGSLKGRKILPPAGPGLRPTSDRLRETLFAVLDDLVPGARVLDAFAGTGALGLEALSRGARAVTFVESDPRALKVLEANVRGLDAAEACAIIRGDFLRARIAGAPFDLVLLDPPYDSARVEDVLDRAASVAAPTGWIVFEHSRRRTSPDQVGAFARFRVLPAGDSALSFYAAAGSPAETSSRSAT
jgi:16S rRNA (guanine966-N2)-methyltransferase